MIFCLEKILEFYKNSNIDPKNIKTIVEKVQDLHDRGLSQRDVLSKVEDISQDMNINMFYELSREALHQDKILSLKQIVTNEAYRSDMTHAINDILFNSPRALPGTGESVQNLKAYYLTKLSKPMDMAIISRDGGRLFQEMQGFTDQQWTTVLEKMFDPSLKVDPAYDFLASVFNHQNDFTFAQKSRAGVPDFYNSKYGFKIVYDGENIKEAGLRQFALDLIENTNFRAKEITEALADKNRFARTLKFLRDPNTTEKQIRNLLNSPSMESEKLLHSHTLLKAAMNAYDTWAPENSIFSTELYDQYTQAGKGFSLFKERQWDFNSAKDQMYFMSKYGRHGTDIYKYVKEDARSLSTSLAFIDKMGPKPTEAFDELMKFAVARSRQNNIPFNELSSREKFDFVANRYVRIPDKIDFSLLDPTKNLQSNLAITANKATQIASSSILCASGITQMIMDPANVMAHYLFKSNENFAQKIATFMGEYFASLKDANFMNLLKANPNHFMELTDIMERTLGEVGLSDQLKESVPGALANFVSTVSGAKYFNRVSAILGFRILNHMIKGGYVADAETMLARYGMTPKDLDFVQTHLSMVDSPARLDILPDSIFENNPAKMKPKYYKEKISKSLGLYLEENRRQFSTQVGDKEKYYFVISGNDETNLQSVLMKAFSHLKLIGFKQLNDLRQLTSIKADSLESNPIMKNRLINSGVIFGTHTALLAGAGFASYYLKRLLANGMDKEKADKEMFQDQYKKPAAWRYALVSGAARYGGISAFTESSINAKDASDVFTNALITPAVKAGYVPASAMVAATNYILGKEPVTWDNAHTFVEGLKVIVPGQSVINMTPWAQEYINLQGKWTKDLERIDGK